MFNCPYCTEILSSHSLKANHIRWKHKNPGYSAEGLKGIRENVRTLRRLESAVTETRTCSCGTQFDVTFSPHLKQHVKRFCSRKCANKRVHSDETKKTISDSVKEWKHKNPEKFIEYQSNKKENLRRSSKAERELAERLKPLGFLRNRIIKTDELSFAVDIMSPDGKVWVESDGEWHFRKVHENHDFEKTKHRDRIEESEALKRGVLLVRVNNQEHSIDAQVEFIQKTIAEWSGDVGNVKKL